MPAIPTEQVHDATLAERSSFPAPQLIIVVGRDVNVSTLQAVTTPPPPGE